LIEIRNGKYKLHEIRTWGRQLEDEALKASDISPLATTINRENISKIVAHVYQQFWNEKRF